MRRLLSASHDIQSPTHHKKHRPTSQRHTTQPTSIPSVVHMPPCIGLYSWGYFEGHQCIPYHSSWTACFGLFELPTRSTLQIKRGHSTCLESRHASVCMYICIHASPLTSGFFMHLYTSTNIVLGSILFHWQCFTTTSA